MSPPSAFSVRKEEADPTLDILGGLSQLTGSTSASDPDISYDFLRSQDIVATIDSELDLTAKFSKPHDIDPIFAYNADGTLEDLTKYWRRQVRVHYDLASKADHPDRDGLHARGCAGNRPSRL